jgi:hypothetical protein
LGITQEQVVSIAEALGVQLEGLITTDVVGVNEGNIDLLV